MKYLFYSAILFFASYARAGMNLLPENIPAAQIGVEQAISKVSHHLGFDPAKKHWRLVAVVWSPLTCAASENPPFCYYVEPISYRALNLGVAGKPEEWSWFVTYAVPRRRTPHNTRKHELCTFQIRENGDVIAIDADNI